MLQTPIPIEENNEPLVSLAYYSPRIKVYPFYYHQKINGSLPDCYVRAGVAERLVQAAERLDDGYTLVVLDGWRPLSVQQALYDQFKSVLLAQGWREGEELFAELSKYVAKPSVEPDRPSRHLTGGAVDVTIAGPNGWLDMGTAFDDFTERARTHYFEQVDKPDDHALYIRTNRRLLHRLMAEAGFTNYSEEWWHYDFGNQAWALQTGQPAALYGGILSLE
ncbi:M15 family metallopeptidase [Brevibacillus sp. H7]|uniref:M15 family metallopeptidase n=1 Tax=Brevibacillus sp. H7 TaxID=3349138 RepID=UPI0037F73002